MTAPLGATTVVAPSHRIGVVVLDPGERALHRVQDVGRGEDAVATVGSLGEVDGSLTGQRTLLVPDERRPAQNPHGAVVVLTGRVLAVEAIKAALVEAAHTGRSVVVMQPLAGLEAPRPCSLRFIETAQQQQLDIQLAGIAVADDLDGVPLIGEVVWGSLPAHARRLGTDTALVVVDVAALASPVLRNAISIALDEPGIPVLIIGATR